MALAFKHLTDCPPQARRVRSGELTASRIVWQQRRFCTFSHWGMLDVTDMPFCVPLNSTVVYWVFAPESAYDGTE